VLTYGFRIGAPLTLKGAALHENGGADPWSILDGITLNFSYYAGRGF
jgi:hypothetical protein